MQQYMVDLTRYLRMLRAGYPDTRLVAVHTMPQRNARLQPGHCAWSRCPWQLLFFPLQSVLDKRH